MTDPPPLPVLPGTAAAVEEAARALRAGRLVAFPTETVYGLGARADDDAAVAAIYAAKGRPATNPLIVHLPDLEAVEALVGPLPPAGRALAAAFWPGPLTLVVPLPPGAAGGVGAARAGLSPRVTAGQATLAVRVPDHPLARALLRATDLPIAAPSANRSTGVSPTRAEHVARSLAGRGDLVALVLDGGPTGYGIESTIVDVTVTPCEVLRPGAIPAAALRAHVVLAAVGPGASGQPASDAPEGPARAPGRQAVHYAPRAALRLVAPGALAVEAAALRAAGRRVGTLARRGAGGDGDAAGGLPESRAALDPTALDVTLPDEPSAYAARLYAELHRFDDLDCDALLVAAPPPDEAWAAVADRLGRAAERLA